MLLCQTAKVSPLLDSTQTNLWLAGRHMTAPPKLKSLFPFFFSFFFGRLCPHVGCCVSSGSQPRRHHTMLRLTTGLICHAPLTHRTQTDRQTERGCVRVMPPSLRTHLLHQQHQLRCTRPSLMCRVVTGTVQRFHPISYCF